MDYWKKLLINTAMFQFNQDLAFIISVMLLNYWQYLLDVNNIITIKS
jgi:hypothetical protein